MSAQTFRSRWLAWKPGDPTFPPGDADPLTQLTDAAAANPSVSSVSPHGAERPKIADPIETATPVAVLLRGTIWGDLWLIAGDDVLTEYASIVASALPILRYADVSKVQALDAAELRALGFVLRAFPTARLMQ